MNRKYEDKLIELAFGDLSPEDAQRLEAEATRDSEAARALNTYRDMRTSLRAMAEVPDHQLSNDRLRDAILARGLRNAKTEPERSGGSRSWIWMPVAAGAMAFAFVLLRSGMAPAPTPQIMGSAPVAMNLETPDIRVPESEPARSTDFALIQEMSRALVRAAVPAMRTRMPEDEPAPPTRRERRDGYVARNDRAVASTSRSLDRAKRATPVEKDLPPSIQETVVMETQSEPNRPIVLIAQEQDADTGAQVATEVQSASNVLVGG